MRALALLLVAAPALADQSLPEERARGNWRGRCVERMERAREELARADRRYRDALVEARARERSAPGDPTAAQIVDAVVFYNFAPENGAEVAADGEHSTYGADDAPAALRRAVDDCLRMMKKRK